MASIEVTAGNLWRGGQHIEATWYHRIDRVSDASTVILGGELDLSSSGDLTEVLVDEVGRGGSQVQVDLHAVTFIDSSGITALVRAYHAGRSNNCRFAVTGARAHVRKVLDITGVLAVLSTASAAPH